jgi:4-amino-4-deoxy-L-arabinose transferase-like glycosyltransferase
VKHTLCLILILVIAATLRFYKIADIPHGLYIDEVSIGYNAYTLLHSGKDEYGIAFPLFFKAFGEYKMPVYIYLTSLSIALLGKTEFAIRFPSAIFGTATVLLLYLFLKQLLSLSRQLNKKLHSHISYLPLIAAALLAISPWHIQFSRGGFEANFAVFLYLFSLFLVTVGLQKKRIILLLFSLLSCALTLYTYNTFRLIAPLTMLSILILTGKIISDKKAIAFLIIVSLVSLLPITIFSFSTSGTNRFLETSAFSNYQALPLWQKGILFPLLYLKNYLSYFSLPVLFATSDGFGRHTIHGIGPLFHWQLPFMLIGLYFLLKNKTAFFAKVTLFLLLIAPITAAFTLPSPHMLRSLPLVIPLTIASAYGITILFHQLSRSRWKLFLLSLLLILTVTEGAYYLHLYYYHYPLITALDWGAEYKQLIAQASQQQHKFSHIVINQNVGGITEYIKFYNDKLPYTFVDNTWKKPSQWKNQPVLYITGSDPQKNTSLKTIRHTHLQDIRLPNQNQDIFAQFWKI